MLVGEKAFIATLVVATENFLIGRCLKRALQALVVDRGQQRIGASKVPKFLSASEPQLILHLDILRSERSTINKLKTAGSLR